MTRILFTYNREKDVWCLLNKGRSSDNSRLPTEIYQKFKDTYGENLTNDTASSFIEKYLSDNHVHLDTAVNDFQRQWDNISQEYHKRCQSIFGIKLPKEIVAYLTVSKRCPYSIEGNLFYVYIFSTGIRRSVMHELLHFYTWHALYSELAAKGVNSEQYNDIKESLTEILNIEFLDLMDGATDNGYPQHKKMREEVRKIWLNTKDIRKTVYRVLRMV